MRNYRKRYGQAKVRYNSGNSEYEVTLIAEYQDDPVYGGQFDDDQITEVRNADTDNVIPLNRIKPVLLEKILNKCYPIAEYEMED